MNKFQDSKKIQQDYYFNANNNFEIKYFSKLVAPLLQNSITIGDSTENDIREPLGSNFQCKSH